MYETVANAIDVEDISDDEDEQLLATFIPPEDIELNKDPAHNFRWRKRAAQPIDYRYTGSDFSDPPLEPLSPVEYFKKFIDSDMIEHCFRQTNLYATQKVLEKSGGIPFSTTSNRIEQFFGILLHMGITKFPIYRMYWAPETRIPAIADIMSRNEFEALKSNLHFNDNSAMPARDKPDYDPIYKVRPFVEKLRLNCMKIEPEEKHSVDEMIVPTKTRWGIRQYNPKKPHKWGIKVWARCGVSGFVYDFSVYIGAEKNNEVANELGVSAAVVANLCKSLPENVGHKIYCDNYFTSPNLFIYLRTRGIFCLGTVRSNRLKGGDKLLKSEKDLKANGRGSCDSIVDANSSLCALRWLDNGSVTLISNFLGAEMASPARRWSVKDKDYIEIPRPEMVLQYNLHMGGVDLADMLVALYRIKVGTKKPYMRLVFFCLNVAVVNAWLLYRRHCKQLKMKKRDIMHLISFQSKVANGLLLSGKSLAVKQRGRPSVTQVDEPPVKRGPKTATPDECIRFDETGHFPEFVEKQQKCHMCAKSSEKPGYTFVQCSKCHVYLCLVKNRNCFTAFHKK
jgi:Transposase IS4